MMDCAQVESVSCQLCGYLSPNLRVYVSHLRLVHSKESQFSLVCGIQECSQHFSTFGAYNSHVYHMHRSNLGLDDSKDANLACANEENAHEQELSPHVLADDVYPGPTYHFESHDPPVYLAPFGYEQRPTAKASCYILVEIERSVQSIRAYCR